MNKVFEIMFGEILKINKSYKTSMSIQILKMIWIGFYLSLHSECIKNKNKNRFTRNWNKKKLWYFETLIEERENILK